MKRVFSTGSKLVTGLMLLLVSGAVMAKTTIPATYVKDGIDLSAYNKVMVKPLSLDNIEVLKPSWEEGNDDIWAFNPENRSDIQKWFLDAMQQEIEINGGYKLVNAPGDDVLRVEVEVLSITPYVKPGTQSSDSDHVISTLGSGDGSFMRLKSSVVNDAISAEWSRTSLTRTSTAVFIGSLIAGVGGNGGVVSDSSTLLSS